MRSGGLYMADDPELSAARARARALTRRFNACDDPDQARAILRDLLGGMGARLHIEPPFRCDYGQNITFGEDCYVNYDCIILDVCPVTIGDRVLIAPRAGLYAAGHPVDAAVRATGLENGGPITIEDDVWLGGNVTVNPGVTIGAGSVIGSGSVVTHDIPPGVVAAGNPCRVIRPIGEEDRRTWEAQREAYLRDQ